MGMHVLQSLQIVGRPAETKSMCSQAKFLGLERPWMVQMFSRAWKLDGR